MDQSNDQPNQIQIPDLQPSLRALEQEGTDTTQAKASLFNLIILANEPARVRYFEELITTILGKFPCRIILIEVSEEAQPLFRLSMSSVLSGIGKEQVACDKITIQCSKSEMQRVPSILFPSVLPDLPIYLLWGQSPFEEHQIFPCLQPFATRLIIDAECCQDFSIFGRQMEANLNLLKMDIMDMNWALLSGWRDLLWTIFDRPEKLQLLQRCKSAIITYNNIKTETVKHPEVGAIYLQGWLAANLETTYRKTEYYEDSLIISYFGPLHPLVIGLEPKIDEEQPPGAILEMSMEFTNGDSYVIIPKAHLSQALIHESSVETCALPYTLPLPNVHSGISFLNALLYQKVGEHYRKMLRAISHLHYSAEHGTPAY